MRNGYGFLVICEFSNFDKNLPTSGIGLRTDIIGGKLSKEAGIVRGKMWRVKNVAACLMLWLVECLKKEINNR